MENKQGMSAVVTTLIIILLAIVALGIIWVVVKNVIQGGAEQVEWAEKCRSVEITAVKIEASGANSDDYTVTLSRTGAGEETIGGVKLVFSDGTDYSDVIEFGIAIEQLQTRTGNTTIATGVTNATELQITPYFTDDLGERHNCETRYEEF